MREPLIHAFEHARNEEAYRKAQQAFAEHSQREREEKDRQKEKQEQDRNTEFVAEVVEQRARIAELEARMAETYKILQKKYGDDVVGGMAGTWLTPEELATLNTDEERLRAVSDKLLDDDGAIKPPYVDIPDAHYVRDWTALEVERNLSPDPEPTVETSPLDMSSLVFGQ